MRHNVKLAPSRKTSTATFDLQVAPFDDRRPCCSFLSSFYSTSDADLLYIVSVHAATELNLCSHVKVNVSQCENTGTVTQLGRLREKDVRAPMPLTPWPRPPSPQNDTQQTRQCALRQWVFNFFSPMRVFLCVPLMRVCQHTPTVSSDI